MLALMIEPAARLGLMVAAGEAFSGRFPMPIVLISAFRAGRERLKSMVILGLLHALACACVMALSMLITVDVPKTDPLPPQAQFLIHLPIDLMNAQDVPPQFPQMAQVHLQGGFLGAAGIVPAGRRGTPAGGEFLGQKQPRCFLIPQLGDQHLVRVPAIG